jgi:MYXO-CTERM domain-containing protein
MMCASGNACRCAAAPQGPAAAWFMLVLLALLPVRCAVPSRALSTSLQKQQKARQMASAAFKRSLVLTHLCC